MIHPQEQVQRVSKRVQLPSVAEAAVFSHRQTSKSDGILNFNPAELKTRMAAALKIRYVYETCFFDGRGPDWTSSSHQADPPDQVDSAINHPIVRRIQQAVNRARKAVVTSSAIVSNQPQQQEQIDHDHHSSDDGIGIMHPHQRRSSISTLQTASSDSDDSSNEDGRLIFLNRSRSLQQTHLLDHQHRPAAGFSLHLSPKQRTRMSEAVLSPISDKSENETTSTANISTILPSATTSKNTTTGLQLTNRRRPQSLFPAGHISRTGGNAFNSSDSGISISANSLVASHEALQPPNHQHVSLNNSHEFLSSSSSSAEPPPEENLPFLMPKLRRAANNGLFQQPQAAGPVRQLSLTLPFPTTLQILPFSVDLKDLVDDAIPLEIQSWYHGSITRRDAEKRLRPAPAGSFLVRDSMASHDDYFLAARSENGFLHVRIDCHGLSDDLAPKEFTLATLPDRRFQSVAAAINHCANIGVYSRQLPPMVLKYPLAEEPV